MQHFQPSPHARRDFGPPGFLRRDRDVSPPLREWDARERSREPDGRPDLLRMAYEEYVEQFRRMKALQVGGGAEAGLCWFAIRRRVVWTWCAVQAQQAAPADASCCVRASLPRQRSTLHMPLLFSAVQDGGSDKQLVAVGGGSEAT